MTTHKEIMTRSLPVIRDLAGSMPGKDIAARVGVSYSSLTVFCSRHKISLRVNVDTARKTTGNGSARQKQEPAAAGETRAAVTAGLAPPEARADLVAGLVADLFDIDTSNSKDPVADVIRFLKHKLNT